MFAVKYLCLLACLLNGALAAIPSFGGGHSAKGEDNAWFGDRHFENMGKDKLDIEQYREFVARHASETNGAPSGSLSVRIAVQKILEYYEQHGNNLSCTASRFYTIDGTCNNLRHPLWGAAFTPFRRLLPNAYHDGKSIPRLYSTAVLPLELLPSARLVSTGCIGSLFREKKRELHRSLNQNSIAFAQFFSHDTGLSDVFDGVDCCKNVSADHIYYSDDCFAIPVPHGDRAFNKCIPLNRTIAIKDKNGVVQQLNSVTSFIDQSLTYGATKAIADEMRSFQNGRLKTDSHDMLPQEDHFKCKLEQAPEPLAKCPFAGDDRVNEFPGLTITHLIFLMEHNRIAGELQARNPHWDDERLYQEARSILIAVNQHITLKELLPFVIGPRVMRHFGLHQRATYNPECDPSVFNEFQAGAMRFGHTFIDNHFVLNPALGEEELQDIFFRPEKLFNLTSYQPIFKDFLKEMMQRHCARFDPKMARSLLDFLYKDVDFQGQRSDLAARNVQRGRGHGLRPFFDYMQLGLAEFGNSTEDIVDQVRLPNCVGSVYKHLTDVDLWIGGNHEDRVKFGNVGPTFAYIFGLQMKNTRQGDRLWFDSYGGDAGFTEAQIRSMKKVTYAGMVCRNSQAPTCWKHAFKVPHAKRNPLVWCKDIPDVNFDLWKE